MPWDAKGPRKRLQYPLSFVQHDPVISEANADHSSLAFEPPLCLDAQRLLMAD